jgi:hypothetical protein
MVIWTKTNFFCEVGNFIRLIIHGKQINYKNIFFQKLWKKAELLMVLTLKFDKNSVRYITLNLQCLFRTVLVWHFKNFLENGLYETTLKINKMLHRSLKKNKINFFLTLSS